MSEEFDREDEHEGSWWLFIGTLAAIAAILYAVGASPPPATETLLTSAPAALSSTEIMDGALQSVVAAIIFALIYDWAVRFSGVPLPYAILRSWGESDE